MLGPKLVPRIPLPRRREGLGSLEGDLEKVILQLREKIE